MDTAVLGNSGIEVSRLCFGTLTLGPLQANLPVKAGGEILAHAICRGVSFFDTAQIYETYPYLLEAMERTGAWDIVISSKTYAYTADMARAAVEQARRELNRDYIDVFMLHEQESIHTLRGHQKALEVLYDYKSRGIIRAVGASMHHVAAVYGAIEMGLDVIHPLLNMEGLGIVDGGRKEMECAVREAHINGVGVFSMKPLGGGNLFKKAEECLKYSLSLDCVDSIALGMQSVDEVDSNVDFFGQGFFSKKARAALIQKKRRLHIDSWCEGCGLCEKRCPQKAVRVVDGRAVCDNARCVLCGYCAPVCPMWAIKVV